MFLNSRGCEVHSELNLVSISMFMGTSYAMVLQEIPMSVNQSKNQNCPISYPFFPIFKLK